ncbi:hypothetical protein KQI64_08520 [Lachnoclostridium sp. MSJ-17]|nr:hypothetical protein [Lachnoclostridium sp. MSJ-17]
MYVDPMLYAAEELANAVIIQAAIDYRQAMKRFMWMSLYMRIKKGRKDRLV